MDEKEKVNIKASANLFPVLPTVMVSVKGVNAPYDKDNIITLARVTSLTSKPPCVCISIKESRFSYRQIIESSEFVINFVDSDLLYAADWCGIKSGSEYDKFKVCKLTSIPTKGLTYAPSILESKLSLGCKLVQTVNLAGYGIFIGEVVSVFASREAVSEEGKLLTEKIGSLVFDSISANYQRAGENKHSYGFSLSQG